MRSTTRLCRRCSGGKGGDRPWLTLASGLIVPADPEGWAARPSGLIVPAELEHYEPPPAQTFEVKIEWHPPARRFPLWMLN